MGTAVPGGEASVFRLTWHPWGSSEIEGPVKPRLPISCLVPGTPFSPRHQPGGKKGRRTLHTLGRPQTLCFKATICLSHPDPEGAAAAGRGTAAPATTLTHGHSTRDAPAEMQTHASPGMHENTHSSQPRHARTQTHTGGHMPGTGHRSCTDTAPHTHIG